MATADEYATWIIKNADKKGSPEFDVVARAYQDAKTNGGPKKPDAIEQGALDFAKDMPGWRQAVAGYGKAGVDLARGIGQRLGVVDQSTIDEAKRLDSPLMKTGLGVAGNITGNIATMIPAAALPGSASLLGAGAIGAVTGALQPTASDESGRLLGMDLPVPVKNAILGAALSSGAVGTGKLIGGAWRASRAALEPFTEAGQKAITGRALVKAAGEDAPAVAERLQQASAPFVGPSAGAARTTMGELVPGSMPTVGQAAENPGVAALERAATATQPDVTNAITKLYKSQNAARVNVLEDMAGAGGKRDFFAADRGAVADQLYSAARKIGVDPEKLTPEALQNIAKFSERIPDDILAKARQLAKIKGEPMTDATSIDGMHWVKMAIDDSIDAAKRSGNTTLERAYVGLQKDLLTGIDNLSPVYQAARKTFADMSKPINQMDVAQALLDKSRDKFTGNLRGSNYARALTDDTAAKATGLPSATLGGTMDNGQMNALQSLLLDMRRASAAEATGGGSDTVRKLAYSNILDQSGVPSFLRNFKPTEIMGNLAGRAADAAYAGKNKEMSARLAQLMMDPGEAGQAMREALTQQRGPTPNNLLMLLASQARRNTSPSIAQSTRQP